MAISEYLLEILRCPACRATIRLDGDTLLCTSAACRRRYDIDDDIPVMLIDKATVLDQAAWRERLAALGALPSSN